MRYRPTPNFIAVLIGLVLAVITMSILVAIQKHRINKDAEVQISRNQWGQRSEDAYWAYARWKEIANER